MPSNVLFCPQLEDISFIVTEEKIFENSFTFE